MKYFFDTYAIIEIVKENTAYRRYLDEEIVTGVLNLGELYYALLRDFNEKVAKQWVSKLERTTMSIDLKGVIKAMDFKFENREKNFSFIDCVSYALAKENKLSLLTGDKEFKGLENVEFVK